MRPAAHIDEGDMPIELWLLSSAWKDAAHSLYGASGAPRYFKCPGSVIANALGEDTAGFDAAYGVVAHSVTEEWRNTDDRPTWLEGSEMTVVNGRVPYAILIDDEMLSYCETNYNETKFLSGTKWNEHRVDFSDLTPIPYQGGRADCIILLDDKETLIVYDDKFGIAYRIDAEWNEQLMLYAYGALRKFDPDKRVKKIITRIGQPRLDHQDEFEMTRDDLMQFAGSARSIMYRAWSLDAPRVAGEQCTFCRAKATCPAFAKFTIDLFEGEYEAIGEEMDAKQMRQFLMRLDDEPIPVDHTAPALELSTEHMLKLFPLRKVSDKYWKALADELMVRTVNGQVASLKVVAARSRRSWRQESRVVEALKSIEMDGKTISLPDDAIYQTKLRSPKQMEAQLRVAGVRPKDFEAILGPVTYKPPGNPTLAPLSDRRPAITDTSELYEPVRSDDEDGDDL